MTAASRRVLARQVARLALGLGLGMSGAAVWSADNVEEVQLRAAFVYRFAQFTQWPPPPLREFTYCVAGIDNSDVEVWRKLSSKPMSAASVQMQRLDSPQHASQCQLLVLGFSDRAELRRWLAALADEPVLVIGNSPEAFRAGATIGLVLEPNGLSFRVNNTEAKRRGLVLSSQMLKLAREVR